MDGKPVFKHLRIAISHAALDKKTEKESGGREGTLQDSSRFCVGCDTSDFGSSFRIFLGNPAFPGFPRSRVLPGEGNRHNLVVPDLTSRRVIGRKHVYGGIGPLDLAIEEVSAEGLAGFQCYSHVATIIKRHLHRLDEFGEGSRLKYSALRRSGYAATVILGIGHRKRWIIVNRYSLTEERQERPRTINVELFTINEKWGPSSA